MGELLVVVLDALVGGVVLWLAAKITLVDLALSETVIAAGGAAAVAWCLRLAGYCRLSCFLFCSKNSAEQISGRI